MCCPRRQANLQGIDRSATGEPQMSGRGGVVFVFAGHGCQWRGMAADLLEASPVFVEQIQKCEDALAPYLNWSLHDVLASEPGAPALARVDIVQPALFAVSVALAAVWRPAACTRTRWWATPRGRSLRRTSPGASLADAALVVALRSQALSQLSGKAASWRYRSRSTSLWDTWRLRSPRLTWQQSTVRRRRRYREITARSRRCSRMAGEPA